MNENLLLWIKMLFYSLLLAAEIDWSVLIFGEQVKRSSFSVSVSLSDSSSMVIHYQNGCHSTFMSIFWIYKKYLDVDTFCIHQTK